MIADQPDRPIDILLWGASGFTGKLVAEYLTRVASGTDLRWILGGRSRKKLERVRKELSAIDADTANPDIRVADAQDWQSLEALVDGVKVVCTTVGPYALYGDALIDICARKGVHYCDLTGETPWMRHTIAVYNDVARDSGARLVHTCGFDSIPSDIGVHVLQQHALQTLGMPCEEIAYLVTKMRGGFSGGTVASILTRADNSTETRRVISDPYSLNPPGVQPGPDASDQRGVGYESALGTYTAPFMMAGINTRVVRRTNALLGYPYGRDFSYRESIATGSGPVGFMAALAITGAMAGFFGALAVKPLRRLLANKVLPKPGEGPSREKREAGGFTIKLVGFINGMPRVQCTVVGTEDPGAGETSKMFGESALCLALDGDKLPWPGGGVLTPAACMGSVLVERLRAAGMTFEAESWS